MRNRRCRSVVSHVANIPPSEAMQKKTKTYLVDELAVSLGNQHLGRCLMGVLKMLGCGLRWLSRSK
jgi:hypothetical protein